MQGLTTATFEQEDLPHPSGCHERRRAAASACPEVAFKTGAPAPDSSAINRILLAGYARTRLLCGLVGIGATLLAGFLVSAWLPPASTVVWTAVALCAQTLLTVLCLCFRKPNGLSSRLWTSLFVFAEWLCGLSWAWLLVLLVPEQRVDPAVLQLGVMLAVISAGTTFAAALPAAATAATAPVALTMVVLFAARQAPLYLVLAFLAIATEILFLSLSQRLHRSLRNGVADRTERARLTGELTAARAAAAHSLRIADEANRVRSRFLATVNHELRTPLNAILGFSEVMKNEVLGPMQNGTYRDYAADIHASGSHLLALIDEVLDFSGIEAGRYEREEIPVDLAEIAASCEATVAARALERGQRLTVEAEPDLPKLRADPRGLRQILLHLLSNAVKFAPADGEITVRVGWTAGGGQYVSVSDNGPGIPAAELATVLSPFGRGDHPVRMATPGLGMGLPIAAAITALHGGRFELRSVLGEGTTALATFPRSRVLVPEPMAAAEREGNVLLWRSAS
ncbi:MULTISPECIES: sensor histidine kinase [Kaistia]|uniref:histidine kinase n=1 Tax=Kaistia nematophila TaxID=2994654 RepID=A0A9X3DZ55_9HYPH|nr:HAMP domain-containing sensor histidine kinase [Kaistia nematophila]MCX5568721.1 HAMP domain-containing sensor histidine kinase [Kaistia nematophila]